MQFYLGTHRPSWLARVSNVPLFVSRRTLPRQQLPRALGHWALDSGGFSELSLHGSWSITASQYADLVHRYSDEIGNLDWAAPMDWMCEPPILAMTGLSIDDHQERTIDSVIELRSRLGMTIIPVLQGWSRDDYLRHVDHYARRGLDLSCEPLVGVGTVCRRQNTAEAELILRSLADLGLRLHAFGAKTTGLRRYHQVLRSSDSMAWSYNARRHPPLPGHQHKNCANCFDWAMTWRGHVLDLFSETGTSPRVV